MISLLGSVLGFASGVVPEVVGYFRKQQDHKFELELYEAKAKYAETKKETAKKEEVQKDNVTNVDLKKFKSKEIFL